MPAKQKTSAPRVVEAVETPSPAAEPERVTALRVFENYELLWETCRDALSVTYAAKRSELEGLLSVRIFNEQVRADLEVRTLRDAATKAVELTHANAVAVYESGVGEDGSPYVVTELLEGHSLADLLAGQKRPDVGSLLRIFLQVCDALIEAHGKKLIHGNLSPSKIVSPIDDVDFETVKLIDFGMPPDPVQNAFYTCPDQWLDKGKIDEKSDIYSLGCVMYECIVGKPPFVGHNRSDVSLNQLHELANQFPPDSSQRQALKLLDCIIVKCLQTNRWKRFRNVSELADALRLVSDCISHDKARKLPPKAERLLLFRFLDVFDAKIVACATLYIALALFATKAFAEFQLQRYIDNAQMAVSMEDWSLAQANWSAALHQAEWANKPQSLQAELHWALGDTCRMQCQVPPGQIRHDALRHDAIEEYQKAATYYSHGMAGRSDLYQLLALQADQWHSMNVDEWSNADRDAALREIRSKKATGDLKKLVELADDYALRYGVPAELSQLASDACMGLANTAKPIDALRYYAHAYYYKRMQRDDGAANRAFCQTLLKMGKPTIPETAQWARQQFMVAGDPFAASVLIAQTGSVDLAQLALSIYDGYPLPPPSPRVEQEILCREKMISILRQIHGNHNPILAEQMAKLGRLYAANHEHVKAATSFNEAITCMDRWPYDEDQRIGIHYVDSLLATNQKDRAIQFLKLRCQYEGPTGLAMPLLKLYAERGMQKAGRDLLVHEEGESGVIYIPGDPQPPIGPVYSTPQDAFAAPERVGSNGVDDEFAR